MYIPAIFAKLSNFVNNILTMITSFEDLQLEEICMAKIRSQGTTATYKDVDPYLRPMVKRLAIQSAEVALCDLASLNNQFRAAIGKAMPEGVVHGVMRSFVTMVGTESFDAEFIDRIFAMRDLFVSALNYREKKYSPDPDEQERLMRQSMRRRKPAHVSKTNSMEEEGWYVGRFVDTGPNFPAVIDKY